MPSEKLLSQVLKGVRADLYRWMSRRRPFSTVSSSASSRCCRSRRRGVTLIVPGGDPEYISASDPAALWYERLQTQLREVGRVWTAYESGEAV